MTATMVKEKQSLDNCMYCLLLQGKNNLMQYLRENDFIEGKYQYHKTHWVNSRRKKQKAILVMDNGCLMTYSIYRPIKQCLKMLKAL